MLKNKFFQLFLIYTFVIIAISFISSYFNTNKIDYDLLFTEMWMAFWYGLFPYAGYLLLIAIVKNFLLKFIKLKNNEQRIYFNIVYVVLFTCITYLPFLVFDNFDKSELTEMTIGFIVLNLVMIFYLEILET